MTNQALVPVEDQLALTPSPEQEIEFASRIATQLSKIIEDRKLYKKIGDKKHVYVEGWTAVAALRGVTPREVSNKRQEDGSYIAVVELVNAHGRVIGNASAECGGPEEPIWQNRHPYARRSMAATRATSKVCRLCFSWIMVLSGYAGTPGEEMDGIEHPVGSLTAKKAPTKRSEAPKRASGGGNDSWDGELEIRSGKNKGKRWKDLNTGFLDWAIEKKGDEPIGQMAHKEVARRLAAESGGDVEVVDTPDTPPIEAYDEEAPF